MTVEIKFTHESAKYFMKYYFIITFKITIKHIYIVCIILLIFTLPLEILAYIALAVGIFPDAKRLGKHSLPRVQCVLIFFKEGLNI